MRLSRTTLMLAVGVGFFGTALAQSNEIRIAHIIDKTGAMEPYATATNIGLMMGIEYATQGRMEIAGKKFNVFVRDSMLKPDQGKALLQAAYRDGRADIAVRPTSSAVALAMLPAARENKKILMIDAAAAENLTGHKGNRYVFRTGRNSDHDGYANAIVHGRADTVIATLAPDYAYGREGIQSFRDALKMTPAKLVHEEYAPVGNTDFTAQAQRIFNALKDQPGRKIIWYLWAGPGNPLKILDQEPKRHGIEVVTGGNILPALAGYRALLGSEGATHYYFKCPKNPINDWLIKEHLARHGTPPDFFTATGMMTGIAIVEALKKTQGNTDTETLIKALEGLAFDSPKGRVFFHPDNHQLMQPMYHFRVNLDPEMDKTATQGVGHDCLREVGIEEMKFPIVKLKD
mgnify:CR=1 FL=1